MSPSAPEREIARGFHPLSVAMTAITSARGTTWTSSTDRTAKAISASYVVRDGNAATREPSAAATQRSTVPQ